MFTKQAHAEALQKIAAVDERDAACAFEAGLMKAAMDLGLNEAEYQLFRAEVEARLKAAAKA